MAIMEKCNTKIMTLSQGVSTPSRLDFLAQSTSRKFKKEKRKKKKEKKRRAIHFHDFGECGFVRKLNIDMIIRVLLCDYYYHWILH